MPRCFVMQPFDGAEFDKRFDEVYKEAIEDAGFDPYRVDRDDSASIPIVNIESGIKNSSACFADISVDNPNVWFELGYAICANKPLCLVCSNDRYHFPFDVQHRKIIRYKTTSPSDFLDLRNSITNRLKAIQEQDLNIETMIREIPQPERGNLSDMELSALCVILEETDSDVVSTYQIVNGMERLGYNKLGTRFALLNLVSENLIESYIRGDFSGNDYKVYALTSLGKQHIISNIDRMQFKTKPKNVRVSDDIPF